MLLFVQSFFSIMAHEWLNIDRLRLDKFYMVGGIVEVVMVWSDVCKH